MKTPVTYDTIGHGYNDSRKADPYISERLLHFLSPQPNFSYLDIGCGTGNYTIKLAEGGIKFTGVDPSETMLNKARKKSQVINWIKGSSEQILFPDSTFDGAIATLTIHHWSNPEKSFSELFRVLKNKTRLVLFTSTPEQMQGYWLNHYFPEAMKKSMATMPSLEKTSVALTTSGFTISQTEKYFVQDDLQDRFLYFGKNSPEIYFDENFRKGISTFSLNSTTPEVETGLLRLKDDLQTNQFVKIRNDYRNELGDYLFIVADKS